MIVQLPWKTTDALTPKKSDHPHAYKKPPTFFDKVEAEVKEAVSAIHHRQKGSLWDLNFGMVNCDVHPLQGAPSLILPMNDQY